MILQALVKRYEDTQEVAVGWSKRKIDYAIELKPDGTFIGTVPFEDGRELILPKEVRTSGPGAYKSPSFLCNNGKFMLGLDDRYWESAAAHHQELLPDSPIARYFAGEKPSVDIKDAASKKFAFLIDDIGFVDYDNEDARNAWDNRPMKEGVQLDLVSGKRDAPKYKHPEIHLDGAQSSGASLVSSNATSFLSYGEEKNHIRGVGEYAAFAYTTALSDLLKKDWIEEEREVTDDNGKTKTKKVRRDRSTHHKRFAADTLVYWAEGGGEAEAERFSSEIDPDEEWETLQQQKLQQDDTGKLNDLADAVSQGGPPEDVDFSRPFHILCLSPNAGRISVRFYYKDNFGNILKNIAAHYDALEIYTAPGKNPEKFPHLPPWILLSETTVKKKSGDAAPLLAGGLLNSIVTGKDYPRTLYNAILARSKIAEKDTKGKLIPFSRTKAAIIKAFLTRNKDLKSEVATMALNPNSQNPAYTLGRLFSVLEAVQSSADNTGLRERYFSGACTNPAHIFPNLLKLSMHHAEKSDYGTGYEIQKTDLIGRLDADTPFPNALDLKQQGEFIVGYYHQQQVRYPKNNKQEDETNV